MGEVPACATHRPKGIPQRAADIDDELKPLIDWLIEFWDKERAKVENCTQPPTTCEGLYKFADDFFRVRLRNNRFCLQRGRSHKANSVFLEVDLTLMSFEQRCWDGED